MERPRGLEPPPTAWQAVVLPLYYGRNVRESGGRQLVFYSTRRELQQGSNDAFVRTNAARFEKRSGNAKAFSLIHFDDARSSHHRGPFLPLSKSLGPLAIDVHARKPLPIGVIDGYLPVSVFAAAVAVQASALFAFSSSGHGHPC